MLTEQKTIKITKQLTNEEDELKIIKILYRNEKLDSFEISNLIKKKLYQTRKMLQRLYGFNLLHYKIVRYKDLGKTSGLWELNRSRIRQLYNNKSKNHSDIDNADISNNNIYYLCRNKCMKYDFDEAFSNNYRCKECNELLDELK